MSDYFNMANKFIYISNCMDRASEEENSESLSQSGEIDEKGHDELLKMIGEKEGGETKKAKKGKRGKSETKGEITEVRAEGEYNAGIWPSNHLHRHRRKIKVD